MDSRIAESKANGTKWMSHGHISAALALFMSDGRYKDHVAIIPPNHMASIKAAKALYNQMDFAEKDSEEYKELQEKVPKCDWNADGKGYHCPAQSV
jgi:hypothetical protein